MPTENLVKKVTSIIYTDYTTGFVSFKRMLIILSYAYRLAVFIRGALYDMGVLLQKRVPCFVISVGNVTAGGSGKTPMVFYIVQYIKKMGLKPVVLSRGYKGKYREKVKVVSDGKRLFAGPEDVGDEAFMTAKKLACPVVVARNRIAGAMEAVKKFSPDVIVLDDGFQHIKLLREINILLCDCRKPSGNGRMLPAGPLREPFAKAVKRADMVILTRCNSFDAGSSELKDLLMIKGPQKCFFTFHSSYISTYKKMGKILDNTFYSIEVLNGKRGVVFSGIADNRSFRKNLEKSGLVVEEHIEFKDHYKYKEADFLNIRSRALDLQADIIVTTEKDNSKIPLEMDWKVDFAVAGVELVFMKDGTEFNFCIKDKLKSHGFDNI